MKKLSFFALAAALAFTGCSSDEPANVGGNDVKTDASYLAVNIVATPDAAGRAEAQEKGNPNDITTYEEGTKIENEVSKVIFFFFDAEGNPTGVKKTDTGFNNYLVWTSFTDGGKDMPNVTQIYNCGLIIETKKGDVLPAQMFTVVNPTKAIEDLAGENKTLTALRNEVFADYAAYAASGLHVMANSVYMNAAGEEVCTTKLTPDMFFRTSDAALGNPAVVYVERAVAKVRVSLGSALNYSSETKLMQLFAKAEKNETPAPLTVDGKNIYLKLDKWCTTTTVASAYASKHIDTGWDAALLGKNEPWNWAPYFRSYWADACAANTTNVYGDFKAANQADLKAGDFAGESLYINENAERLNGVKASQVIIPGVLVDAEGHALTIVEYAGTKHIDDVNFSLLRKIYADNCKYYFENGTDEKGNTKYAKITPDDIEIVTESSVLEGYDKKDADKLNKGEDQTRYHVYAQLTEAAAAKTWYLVAPDAKEVKEATVAEVNTALIGQYYAKVWNEGRTYYFFDIKHFAKTGVVRNHIYDTTITKIAGFGTPVYDPEEVIIPEPTTEEEYFVAANINILSWRVVFNSADLVWL